MIAVLAAGLAASAAIPAGADALGATPTCSPGPCGAWQARSVRVSWAISSDANYSQGCDVDTIAAEGTTRRVCAVSSDGSAYTAFSVSVRVDVTRPTVTGATPSRAPEATGWYRAPVDVTFVGSDAISGIASCTKVAYAGPDNGAARVTGVCRDRAGNTSPLAAFPLRYDATPPAVSAPIATAGDRLVRLRWAAAPDAVGVEVTRAIAGGTTAPKVVYRGSGTRLTDRRVRNGRRYRYELRAFDAAGNVAVAGTQTRPGPRLLSPVAGATVAGPPRLTWTPVRGARYYNVQLYRNGRKVLSAWPHKATLKLRRSWRYPARRHRLRAGRYRWYVWPGRGRPGARRYGTLIGRGSFVVARR